VRQSWEGAALRHPTVLRKVTLRLKIRLGSSRTAVGGSSRNRNHPLIFARSRASVSNPSSARAHDSRASPPETLPHGRVSLSAPPAREPGHALRLRVRRSVAEPGPEIKHPRTARARRLSLASLSRELLRVSCVSPKRETQVFERVGATSHKRSSVRARPR
jgi:hypothetical protein